MDERNTDASMYVERSVTEMLIPFLHAQIKNKQTYLLEEPMAGQDDGSDSNNKTDSGNSCYHSFTAAAFHWRLHPF